MKKSDWLFVIFDVVLVVWLTLYPGESLKSIVFVFGLLVNDVYVIHLIKYGRGKFSEVMRDFLRYLFVTMFSVAFLMMFAVIIAKGETYVGAPMNWKTLWGIFSVLIFLYYFPAFLAVGRYEMYKNYGLKSFWESVEEGVKKSIRAAFSRDNLVYLGIFYGGFFVVDRIARVFGGVVQSALLLGYFFFVYVALPVVAEKLRFKKKKK